MSTPADSDSDSVSEKKMLTLRSSDGELFEVEDKVAVQSQTIKHMVEDDCAGGIIPLPNVASPTLAKVVEYCNFHDSVTNSAHLKEFDADFVQVDLGTLYDLIQAANYMDIKGLLSLMCDTVAGMIKGKSPEEIRKFFHIENDFTPEEEAALLQENSWGLDP